MKRILILSLLLAATVCLFAAPPFDARWDGQGYRPEPLTPVPGVTEPPKWMILSDNVAATTWLQALDASSDPASTWKWIKKWRQYHPTENKVAIQIRAEEFVDFTVAEHALFIDDPLPAEWWTPPEF